jgi:hypothetical protein
MVSTRHTIHPGYTAVDIELPSAKQISPYGKDTYRRWTCTRLCIYLEPIREWTIYLVQHSHTDIGYRSQTVMNISVYRQCAGLCDQTVIILSMRNSAGHVTAWAVREYLQSGPQSQIDRLLQRIKEGRIEVTSMFSISATSWMKQRSPCRRTLKV